MMGSIRSGEDSIHGLAWIWGGGPTPYPIFAHVNSAKIMWPWIEVGPPTGSQNKCSDVDQENQAEVGTFDGLPGSTGATGVSTTSSTGAAGASVMGLV